LTSSIAALAASTLVSGSITIHPACPRMIVMFDTSNPRTCHRFGVT